MEGHRVKLTEVNPYLVCVLCHGYLVDATTIAECLHSFCRSCIFRQLERKSICPICETHVHNTKLYRSLRPDKTLQDIVYKLVPGLFHNEMQRRRDFYKNHPYRDEHLEPECRGVGLDRLIYSPDDQISLSLEFYDEEREKEEWSNNSSPKPPQFAPSGPKRYLQCPAGFKMLHLKKFLRQKYGLSSNCNVDIMYRRECLPDSYSLMDVAYIYTWKRNSPMRFYYRMPDVVMKQLTAPPAEVPAIEEMKEIKESEEEKETISKSPIKSVENKSEENKENKKEDKENIAKAAVPDKVDSLDKEKTEGEKKENEKPNTGEVTEPQANSITSSRALSKQDELSVSVLLSLGQCRVDNKEDHKFVVPHPVTPKNGIVEKKNGKVSPKPSVNKIASDLAEHKSQQPQLQNSSPQVLQSSPSPPSPQTTMSPQQKQQHLQKQKQLQQMQQQKQKQQLKNQHMQQQKQQQFLHQKQQMHQIMQQQQQKLQQQLQQQHLLQQQQLQQIHLQQVQRHQLQQLQTQQPQILQLQVQPQLQLQQVIHQIKETKPLEQQNQQHSLQQQPVGEQPGMVAKQAVNQMIKVPKSPPVLHQSQMQPQPPQHLVSQQSPQIMTQQANQHLPQQQTQQHLSQQQPLQHLVQQQQPQQPMQQQRMQQSVPQQPPPQLPQQQPTQPSIQQQQLPQQSVQQQLPQQSVQQQQLPQQSVQQQLPQQPVQQQQSPQSAQQQQTQQAAQQPPSQQSAQAQPQPPPAQKSQNQQSQPHQSPQHQKSWPEPVTPENTKINGTANVQNPQVTLNTSNGSVTIMAQLKSPPMVSASLGAPANSPGSPIPTMNGKSPDTPRPQGIHPNLPRTVLPKSPFVNGKPLQKTIQQKNISGQRLNNNLPEGKNGLIQQSNINNRLPTFQKNGGAARKAGIPGGVISKTGPTLDQRIQQLYNSGQTNKPPSPGGKSESRLASWLNNRFKPQPAKEEAESTTPASPPTTKEVSMQRYKRKLQEMQKVQEICEITQENPKPDDAKRRREVTPDVSIELMRAADMKKLDSTKKEKRPVPGLKSIQEVGNKRKKEEDSALDLSRPQLPWLLPRPTHYIPSPRPT